MENIVLKPDATSSPLYAPVATPPRLDGFALDGIPCTSVNVRCVPSAVNTTVLPLVVFLTRAKKVGIYKTLFQSMEREITDPPAPPTKKSSSLSSLSNPSIHLNSCIEFKEL
jgi:hypothetical protein